MSTSGGAKPYSASVPTFLKTLTFSQFLAFLGAVIFAVFIGVGVITFDQGIPWLAVTLGLGINTDAPKPAA